MIITKGE